MDLIGIHINDENMKNIIEAKEKGANFIQFFVKKTMDIDNINKFLIYNNIKCVIHASYTINLAQNWDNYSWSIRQFIEEIELADKLNAIAIVIHMGKSLELSFIESINNMYMSLIYIHQQTKNKKVKILLETSTGQKSEIGFKLEDLALLYRKFSKHRNKEIVDRFGICLDTCHVFVSGHDLRTSQSLKTYLDKFENLIGINAIKLIHLNDSKNNLGSKLDRHDNLGYGFIGKNAIKNIIKFFTKLNVPFILETPDKYIVDDIKYIINNI